ncbi:MAG: hypothetical protein ABJN36_06165 [Cyclobacteriaceae bacterium]
MKKLIPFLFFALFISTYTMAQSRTDLKGPAAKNYKPWQNKEKSDVVYVVSTAEKKQGPAAKNAKVWDRKESDQVLVVDMTSEPKKLKGPAAKNSKPWED